MRPAIFIDFDGTIAPYDVEFEIYKRFGGKDEAGGVVKLWEQGKLDAPERFKVGFSALRTAGVKPQDLNAFLDEVPIDETFPAFLKFLHAQNWPHAILSDGLVWYIERILKNHQITPPPIISNEIDFENNWQFTFPHRNTDCSACRQCATCKRYPIRAAKANSNFVVLITDGRADRWAALECETIFAKEPLLSTLRLWQKPRRVFGFDNFDDLTHQLQNLLP